MKRIKTLVATCSVVLGLYGHSRRRPSRRRVGEQLAASAVVLLTSTSLVACSARSESEPHEAVGVAPVEERVSSERPSARRSQDLASEITEASSLEDCLAYAALHSPKLEAAYYRWQAALEKVPQVKALPDPSVTYAYYIESVETRVGPQEHLAGLKQAIPWLTKLARRGDIQAQAAQAEYERYQGAKRELFYRVKDVYYELYYLRSAIELTADNMELLRQFERIARARYRVAAASHPDVVRVQVELGRLEDRLQALEDLRRPLVARMNAALDRPAGAPVPWPGDVSLPPLEVSETELLERANRQNPSLRALESDVERERAAEKLARLDFFPDFTLGVDYIVTDGAINPSTPNSGQDAVIGRISFNLPLWYEKYSAAEREATKRRTATIRKRADVANELVAQIQQTLYDVRDAHRKVELFRGSLIPKAEESLRASLRGFEGGKVNFLDLLDAERVLLEFQLLERRAESRYGQGVARLEMLSGDDLATAAPSPDEQEATP